jgi:uncharacterized protein YqgQ
MSKIVEKEEYLNTEEVLAELEASKKRFYSNVKPYLRTYHFDAKKTPWYRKRDVLALKSGKLARMASISISGIQRDWTTFLRSLGYRASTVDRTIEVGVSLPEDAVETFKLPSDEKFVKRSRMTIADGVPICVWDTYYPLELVEGDILEEMKHGFEVDVVRRIKEKHGIIVGIAKDKYTARTATFEEQELLQLLTNDPVLILQRASYTRDKKMLVLYSDMVLLGSWFAPEHEYEVNIWEE